MRLITRENTIHNPNFFDTERALNSIVGQKYSNFELVFENGNSIRVIWEKEIGLNFHFWEQGVDKLETRSAFPNYHLALILLYRAVRGETPKENVWWAPARKPKFKKFMRIVGKISPFILYGSFAGILVVAFWLIAYGTFPYSLLLTAFIFCLTVGLTLTIELIPFVRYRNHLEDNWIKDNVTWGMWISVILTMVGFSGIAGYIQSRFY